MKHANGQTLPSYNAFILRLFLKKKYINAPD